VLHLEGETWVRERESGKGGRGGDHWIKMTGVTVREEGAWCCAVPRDRRRTGAQLRPVGGGSRQ
jgi:hypothetical protein